MLKFNEVGIDWLGHSSFRLSKEVTVYIDPWDIDEAEKGDIILITHPHYDHFSKEDIEDIKHRKTVVVGPEDCLEMDGLEVMKPGGAKVIKDVLIKAVPAYNHEKPYHPKSNNWLGYVVEIDGVKVYHAGDTDFIKEMSDLKVDVALLPISGLYTMNAWEAAQAANLIKPKIAVPIHYNKIEGNDGDAEDFRNYCQVEVRKLS